MKQTRLFTTILIIFLVCNLMFGQNQVNIGTLDGAGTINNTLLNKGTISPGVGGSNIGQITINNSFTTESTSIINLELGSASSYDALTINGSAQLSGTLNISFINGYTPTANTVFNVINFSSSTGTFSSINKPALPAGLSWQESYLAGKLELRVIGGASCPTDGQTIGTWNISATTSVVLKMRTFGGVNYLVQIPDANTFARSEFAGASDVFVVRGKNLLIEATSIGMSVTITHPYTNNPQVMHDNCFNSPTSGFYGLYTPNGFNTPSGYTVVNIEGTNYYRNTSCTNPNPPTVTANATIPIGGSATIYASGCTETVVWSNGATGSPLVVSPTSTTTYTAKCKVSVCESGYATTGATITVTTNSCPTDGQTIGTWNIDATASVVLKMRVFGGISYLVQVPGASVLALPQFAGASEVFIVRGKNLLTAPPLGTISITHPYTSSASVLKDCFNSDETYLGVNSPSSFTNPSIPAGFSAVTIDGTTYYKNTTGCSVPYPTITGPNSITLGQANVSLTASGCSGIVTWSNNSTGSNLPISPSVTTNYSATCTIGSCVSTASPNFQVTVNTSAITSAFLSDNAYASGYTGFGSIMMDKSVDNNTITIGGTQYAKGIGTHANSEIIYNLNNIPGGPWTTFETIIGRDDEGDGCGANNVQFYVYVNNVLVGGPYLKGISDAGQFLSFDITGKSTLKLVVDYGTDGGLSCDHADWAMAKVTKNSTVTSAYLSDNTYNSGSYTGFNSIMLDKSVDNLTQTIGGVQYNKGVGTHANSEISYNLNNIPGGPWTNFVATIGRDDEVDGCGTNLNIEFSVYADNVLIGGPYVKGVSDAGQQINLNIAGKSTLKLVVNQGSDGNITCDHADWAMARVTKGGARSGAEHEETSKKELDKQVFAENNETDEILVFPQPATNIVKLKVNNLKNYKNEINIRSIQGAVIKKLSIADFDDNGIVEINISDLNIGLYFAEFQQINGKIKMVKLLKM